MGKVTEESMRMRLSSIRAKLVFLTASAMLAVLAYNFTASEILVGRQLIRQRSLTYAEETLRYSSALDSAVELISDVGRSLSYTASALIPAGEVLSDAEFRALLEPVLQSVAGETPYVYGYGIWFEPGILPGRDYFGPYAYKEGGGAVITYDYSNAEYGYHNQEWYRQARPEANPGRDFLAAKPYYDPATGETFITIAFPIYRDDRFSGVVSIDWTLSFLPSMLDNLKLTDNAYPFLYDRESGNVLYHPDAESVGLPVADLPLIAAVEGDKLSTNQAYSLDYSGEGENMTVYAVAMENTSYVFGAAVPAVEAYGDIQRIRVIGLIIMILVVALLQFLILIFTDRIVILPVKKVAASLETISRQDANLTSRLEVRSRDEIGVLAGAFNGFAANLEAIISQVKGAVKITSADMESVVANSSESAAALHEIKANIESVNASVVDLNANYRRSADKFDAIRKSSEDLDMQVLNQVSAIEQTSASAEEINAQALSIRDTADKRVTEVEALTVIVSQSRSDLSEIEERMKELSRQTDDMMNATSVIGSIASQTNLLSMNAAIEAAHAGEQGKGFAVVAEEIRKLAEDSAANSEAINKSLGFSVSLITTLAESFTRSQTVFSQVEQATETVADSFANIRNTVTELSQGIREITGSVVSFRDAVGLIRNQSTNITTASDEMSRINQENTDLGESVRGAMHEITIGADEINLAVNSLNDSIQGISGQIERIREQVGNFKTGE